MTSSKYKDIIVHLKMIENPCQVEGMTYEALSRGLSRAKASILKDPALKMQDISNNFFDITPLSRDGVVLENTFRIKMVSRQPFIISSIDPSLKEVSELKESKEKDEIFNIEKEEGESNV